MLPTWINKYVGLPYEVLGRGATGYDCWGLVKHVYRTELNKELDDFEGRYQDQFDSDGIEAIFRDEKGRWEKVERPFPFDVVMFNVFGRPVHVGVMVYRDYFVHSPDGDFSRIERIASPQWHRRIEGFYRHV